MMSTTQEPPVITTPDGLPGFDALRSWVIEQSTPDAVFSVMRSLDQPGIGLLVAEPWQLAPGYDPDLPDAEMAAIGTPAPDDLAVFVVARIDVESRQAWLNLAAPIVVNATKGVARQMILDRQGWPMRHPVALGA
jgi:flagellar assembly factor FliW